MGRELVLSLLLLCSVSSFGDSKKLVERNRKVKVGTVEFIKKFNILQPGTSQENVLMLFGKPTSENGVTWYYFEKRAPNPGEQITIYQIVFKDGKVAAHSEEQGPSATGPAPSKDKKDF